MTDPTNAQTKDNAQSLAEACSAVLLNSDTTTQALGMKLLSITPGHATLSMPVTKNMCNGHGTCHGGYLFTLDDSAFAFACNTYNQRTVAQHCSISYLAPANSSDQLTAVAKEVSRQSRSGLYDVSISNQHAVVVAEFRGHSRTIKGTLLPEPD